MSSERSDSREVVDSTSLEACAHELLLASRYYLHELAIRNHADFNRFLAARERLIYALALRGVDMED